MPKILTAREHWDKAFDYFWKGNRRRTINEARLEVMRSVPPRAYLPDWRDK